MILSRRAAGGRRAYSLLELTFATLLVAVAMAVTLKVLAWVALDHREARRRQLALVEVADAMEQITARPWDRLTAESVGSFRPPAGVLESLPGAEWSASLTPETGDPEAKRVAIRLRWRDHAGHWAAPVRLTGWVYQRRERP